jgi:hypothetical protein
MPTFVVAWSAPHSLLEIVCTAQGALFACTGQVYCDGVHVWNKTGSV